MVEAIDLARPVYSAVNINIRKPEINKGENTSTTNDNGIYNSVKVDIDNPAINTEPKKVYDYPENDEVVTYNQTYNKDVTLPEGFPVVTHYESSEIIIPEESEENKAEEQEAETEVPEANYTTLADEKAEKKNLSNTDNEKSIVFKGTEPSSMKPEIIPAEEIKPAVDINSVIDNLNSNDFDKQALQMSEIVKLAKEPEKAKEYLVSDVFSSLINITEKDVSNLAGPTKEQVAARDKIMSNFEAIQQGVKEESLPKVSDEEIRLAVSMAPLELAERNKEYAITTMAMLDKIYIDGVEKENGNVIALTDIPGISSMVDTLRYSKNTTTKIAALDGLRYISRPEYKEELSTVFKLAQADKSPVVSQIAAYSLNKINSNQ